MVNERDPRQIGRSAPRQSRPQQNSSERRSGLPPLSSMQQRIREAEDRVAAQRRDPNTRLGAQTQAVNRQLDLGVYNQSVPDYTPYELQQMMMGSSYGSNMGDNGSGGGGRRTGGGGSGGGGGGVDPATAAIYKQLALQMEAQGASDPFADYESQVRASHSEAPINQRWDQVNASVGAAQSAAEARLAAVQQELAQRAAQGRTDVSQAFSQGASQLQGIQNQFQGQSAADTAGLNTILDRFGAGAVDPSGADASLRNLFAAGQVGNQRAGTVYDAAMADRPAIYAGLNADINQGLTQDRAGLETAVGLQRGRELSANSQALTDRLFQIQQQRIAQQQAQRDQLMKLRLEMAQLGIDLPGNPGAL